MDSGNEGRVCRLCRGQLRFRQGGFQHSEEARFLSNDRLFGIELRFEDEARRKISQPHEPIAVDQFDQIDLEFIARTHGSNLAENRKIATFGRDSVE